MDWLIDSNGHEKMIQPSLIHSPNQEFQVILAEESETVLPMPDFISELTYTIEDLFNLLKA